MEREAGEDEKEENDAKWYSGRWPGEVVGARQERKEEVEMERMEVGEEEEEEAREESKKAEAAAGRKGVVEEARLMGQEIEEGSKARGSHC